MSSVYDIDVIPRTQLLIHKRIVITSISTPYEFSAGVSIYVVPNLTE